MYLVRKAVVADVPKIYGLLTEYGQKGLMLSRSLSELYDVIRDFHVACPPDQPDVLAGACALHVFWQDLGEIRSLGVTPGHRGGDIGRVLLEACQAEAKTLGLGRLFVLTYIPDYFKKFGFIQIEKSALPQKIWADCFKCVKFPECGEIALEKSL